MTSRATPRALAGTLLVLGAAVRTLSIDAAADGHAPEPNWSAKSAAAYLHGLLSDKTALDAVLALSHGSQGTHVE